MAFNPQTAAANYEAGMGSAKAKQKYIDGVRSVSENPLALAAAQKDKAVNNYTDALQSGKWASNLLAYGFDAWKNVTATNGGNNLQAGAKRGKDKYTRQITKMAPLYQQAQDALRTMPRNNLDDAMARVRKNAEIMMMAKMSNGY